MQETDEFMREHLVVIPVGAPKMTAAVTLTFPLGHGRSVTVQGVGDTVVEIPPPPAADFMTAAQETRLRSLCQRYGVTFDAADYHPQFDLPTGYVAGWIGGPEHAGAFNDAGERILGGTIYVGVAPNGDASS